MLEMLLFAMLASASPIDPGLTPPGLDSRAPTERTLSRRQVGELPAIRRPDRGGGKR
jgi:hypothetical protein